MAEVDQSDFYHGPYRLIYAAMCDLAAENQPISVGTVAAQLESLSVDRETISGSIEGASSEEVEYWGRRVVDLRRKRSLLAAAARARELALSDVSADEAFAKTEELLLSTASDRSAGATDMRAGVDEMVGRLERYLDDPDSLAGLATGWARLDRYLDGFRKGGVYTFYAMPSGFKSMLVQNIGWRFAQQGIPGAWFSTETPWHEVMERLVQFELKLNLREIRQARELYRYMAEVRSASEYVAAYPIWGNDQSTLEIGFVRGVVRRLKKQHGIEYVILDLVDHCYSAKHRGNQVEGDEAVMVALKDIAKRENVAIIITSHVRKPDRFSDQTKPYIDPGEMRGSSEKQGSSDAAVSLVLVQKELDGKYVRLNYEDVVRQKEEEGAHLIYAAIMKNRHGETGRILFRVDLHAGGYMQVEADR